MLAWFLVLLVIQANSSSNSLYDSGFFIITQRMLATQQTFTTQFPSPPDVGFAISKLSIEADFSVYAIYLASTPTSTSFSYGFSLGVPYFQTITIQWFAILDDNIHMVASYAQYQPSTGRFPMSFKTLQTTIPIYAFLMNGYSFNYDMTTQATITITYDISRTTLAGIELQLTPSSLNGISIDQIYLTLIYGSETCLQVGEQTSDIQISGESINTVFRKTPTSAVNTMEIAKSNPNKFLVTVTSTGLPTPSKYQYTYFIYQPSCPVYCTSCSAGCDSCVSTTLRTNPPDCQTCPQHFYLANSIINCQQCMNICESCTSSNTCTVCLSSTSRLNPPLCDQCAPQMFVKSATINCQLCGNQCDNCTYDATYCLACAASTRRANPPFCNQCTSLLYYLPQGALDCEACNDYCNGCVDVATQCLACASGTQRLYPPSCLHCPVQMFIQISITNCQPCTSYCDNCQVSSTNCVSCNIVTQRLYPPNCTTCPSNMFIFAGIDNCQQCNPVCNQCIVSSNNCTSCNGLYRTNAPNCDQCSKPNYYISASSNDCQVCESYCNGCVTSSNNCIACWPFSIISLSTTCPTCPITQFTLPSSMCSLNIPTLICSQTYNRDATCNCLAGYYNSETSLSCLKCSSNCQTCTTSATNCLICNTSLYLLQSPTCNICIDGYFMQSNICTQCSNICTTCKESKSTCLTCVAPRQNPPLCSCPNGYYNECKQMCSLQCNSCADSSSNCLTCAGNRINPPMCGCPDGSTQSSQICSLCSLVQPIARFSDDLTSIAVTFLYKLLIQVTCDALLNQKTLKVIGNNPVCTVDLQTILITLGSDATITVNSPIFINSNALQFANCNQQKVEIVTPLVQIPLNTYRPVLMFDKEVYTANWCDFLSIDIVESKYTGSRSLNLIGWSIITATNNLLLIKIQIIKYQIM